MKPIEIGKKYDQLAQWWCDHHQHSSYGVAALKKAIDYLNDGRGFETIEQSDSNESAVLSALDVGCGAGGRFVHCLEEQNFSITGVDVSEKMIDLARKQHPNHQFILEDICTWQTSDKFQLVIAWDSIFHLPIEQHTSVLTKLCRSLTQNGVLLYSFGDAEGEHIDQWRGDTFYYSSIGIRKNIQLLIENGLTPLHLELDQAPESHVYIIAAKR